MHYVCIHIKDNYWCIYADIYLKCFAYAEKSYFKITCSCTFRSDKKCCSEKSLVIADVYSVKSKLFRSEKVPLNVYRKRRDVFWFYSYVPESRGHRNIWCSAEFPKRHCNRRPWVCQIHSRECYMFTPYIMFGSIDHPSISVCLYDKKIKCSLWYSGAL